MSVLKKTVQVKHWMYIIWVDEAGRGAWAGPVCAGACVFLVSWLERTSLGKSLADSKMLTAKMRKILSDHLYTARSQGRLDFAVSMEWAEIIDQFGIKEANRRAMERSVIELIQRLPKGYNDTYEIWVDGRDHYSFVWVPKERIKEFVRGDSKYKVISAASILAKVARDEEMVNLHQSYPQYSLNLHKWYGTALHREKLLQNGPCSLHRQTFAPIKNLRYSSKSL